MKGYTFKEGEEVVNILNKDITMIVHEIKKQQTPYQGGFRTRMVGIECYWFDNNKTIQKQIFHSRVLVPKIISDQGEEVIDKFLKQH